MAAFLRTGLVRRYDDQQLVDGLLSAGYKEPMFGIRMNKLGREILETAAGNQGLSPSDFVRRAIYEAIQSIYTEDSISFEE